MPLPSDPKIAETADGIVQTLKGMFGTPAGFRPAHAKGILLSGTFTPYPSAASLSTAPHFNSASTPILARFSSSTGIPVLPDNDPNGNPRGFAIRFQLSAPDAPRRVHTDIVMHSANGHPVRTGEEFQEFLNAIKENKVGEFLQDPDHAGTVRFVQLPKPFPASFATDNYYGVNAFKFTSKDGKEKYIRYRVVPKEVKHLSEEEAKGKDASYLFNGVIDAVNKGPIELDLVAQVAEEGDVIENATQPWPEERTIVKLGQIKLDKIAEEDAGGDEQRRIIFDPIPRVDGIQESNDPMLQMRAAVYIVSGKERRAAK